MIFEQQLYIRIAHGRAKKHEGMCYEQPAEQLIEMAIIASSQRILTTSEDGALRRIDSSVHLQNNTVLAAEHIRDIVVVIVFHDYCVVLKLISAILVQLVEVGRHYQPGVHPAQVVVDLRMPVTITRKLFEHLRPECGH